MNTLFNINQNFVYLRDISDLVDFSLVNQEFDKMIFEQNVHNTLSNNKFFFDNVNLLEIKHKIESECRHYLDDYCQIKNQYDDLIITKSWCNLTYPGQSHHKHMHPFSVVSGVIFLDDNPFNTFLTFESKRQDIPHFIPFKDEEFSLYQLLRDTRLKDSQTNNLKNHLVLFLSNCDHEVHQLPPDAKPRKTISFDTFWKGEVGKDMPILGKTTF